jgi:aspartate/methionine/tyrosine aminotransferase
LREAIRDYYRDSYGVKISPAQVLVHAGSSPLLLMLFLALLHPDDEVVVPDPGYPAYVTAIRAARGIATPIAA